MTTKLKLSGEMRRIPINSEGEAVAVTTVNLPPEGERKFIVTSRNGWGEGKTIREALKNCRTNNPKRDPVIDKHLPQPIVYRAMLVHESATIDGLGVVTRPAEYAPLNLGIVA